MSALLVPPAPRTAQERLFARLRRFTVAEYHRLIDAGVLREGERVELREGWLVQRMTINPPHAVAVGLTSKRLERLLPAGWTTRIQQPITLSNSEPEPDIAVCRGSDRDYLTSHPTSANTSLIVEVADSSLDEDRSVMARMYARDQVSTYWILNLIEEQVEVYTDPTGDCDEPVYRMRRDFRRAEIIPFVLDGTEVGRFPVADLLP